MSHVLEIVPNNNFDYNGSRTKLLNLNIGDENGPDVVFQTPGDALGTDTYGQVAGDHSGRHGRLMKLAGWINIDSIVTVSTRINHLPTLFNYLITLALGRMCWRYFIVPPETTRHGIPTRRRRWNDCLSSQNC
jgi:hypothetical protein